MEGFEIVICPEDMRQEPENVHRLDKDKYDIKEMARKRFPAGIVRDGEPTHELFKHLSIEGQEQPRGHIQIWWEQSSNFRVPIHSDLKKQVRPIGSLVNLLYSEYVGYILYPRKRTSVKYNWTDTFESVFKALEVDEECPLLILTITSYHLTHVLLGQTISDERHLDLVQRMHRFWCNNSLKDSSDLFFHLIYWVAASRGNVYLGTDYGPDGTLGDMMDVIKYFGKYKPGLFNFPCKTSTFIELGENPRCSEELEQNEQSSSDPLDNTDNLKNPMVTLLTSLIARK